MIYKADTSKDILVDCTKVIASKNVDSKKDI